MTEPDGFLRRWSRLKEAERQKGRREPAAALPAEASAAPAEPPQPATDELPPLESLTKASDYSAFMRPGVPDELRNQALRKLWASDPVYANLDGLLEYGEDFAEPFRLAGVVATVYRVLEGMPGPKRPGVIEPGAASEPAAGAGPQPASEHPRVVAGQPKAPASPIEAGQGEEID